MSTKEQNAGDEQAPTARPANPAIPLEGDVSDEQYSSGEQPGNEDNGQPGEQARPEGEAQD